MQMINPRAGHGYGPVGLFDALFFFVILNPIPAALILVGLICLALIIRYVYRRLRWVENED